MGLETIESASAALSVLSKSRCVIAYYPESGGKNKNLYSWPSTYESDEVLSVLESKNISPEYIKARSNVIGYEEYGKLKKVKLREIREIRIRRTSLLVYKAVKENIPITCVTAIWDSGKDREPRPPMSMSDLDGLKAFSARRDAMLVLKREGVNLDLKVPAFAYRALLDALPELKDCSLNYKDRSEFMGDKTDHHGRSNRFVVHKGNKDYLVKLLRKTVESIDGVIGNSNWSKILKEDGRVYYC